VPTRGQRVPARGHAADGALEAVLDPRHASQWYINRYTNPPEDIAAGYIEDL
jgi:hypothetical protein